MCGTMFPVMSAFYGVVDAVGGIYSRYRGMVVVSLLGWIAD